MSLKPIDENKEKVLHKNLSFYHLSMYHNFFLPGLQQLSNDRLPCYHPVRHIWLSCSHCLEPLPRSEAMLAFAFLFPSKS